MPQPMLIVTGCNAAFFPNLRVNVGAWLTNMPECNLGVCDFGLTAAQKAELAGIEGVHLLEADHLPVHPWLGKSHVGRFLKRYALPWTILMWIDADALVTSPLPPVAPLLAGYDLLADAHVMAIGELCPPDRREVLGLRADDAYFSAGWWIARRGVLLDTYDALCEQVADDRRGLWEGDAFVAAVYREQLKVRSICGSIWHARGKTSLRTCTTDGLVPTHRDHPIYVLHANDAYTRRPDGRRIFTNPNLARIQDHYEAIYAGAVGHDTALTTSGGT